LKKFFSFLLLLILAFDLVGYRLFFLYLGCQADNRMNSRLEEERYDPSELVLIKVPLEHLAYYSNSSRFEKAEGRIEYHSLTYHLVKRRIHNDSLEYFCLPGQEESRVQSAKEAFFSLVYNLEHAVQNRKAGSHPASSRLSVIDHFVLADLVMAEGLPAREDRLAPCNTGFLSSSFAALFDQPPKMG
jgi:hypothetical protein